MRTTALIALVALACLAVSSASAFADDPPEQAGKADSPVSPLLQQFILERESTEGQTGERPSSDAVTRSQADAGVTTKAVQGASGSAKSEAADDPGAVRSSGNVQVYIHVENTNDGTLQPGQSRFNDTCH